MKITADKVMNALLELSPSAKCEKAIVALLNGKSLILTEAAQAACDVLEAAGATWYSARSAAGDEVCWLSQPNISAARSIAAAFAAK